MSLELELVRGANPTYTAIRSKHYVADNGSIGRQLRYMIHYKGQIAGIIAGGMSSLAGSQRDKFFGLDLARQYDECFVEEGDNPIRTMLRNTTIINNTVFRLTLHEHGLASKILAAWREQIAADWEGKYDDRIGLDRPLPVLGFETYVVPHDHGDGQRRDGACYRFDGWNYVGDTSTGKMLYCRKNENFLQQLYADGECLVDHHTVELLEEMFWGGRSVR